MISTITPTSNTWENIFKCMHVGGFYEQQCKVHMYSNVLNTKITKKNLSLLTVTVQKFYVMSSVCCMCKLLYRTD